MGSEPGQDSAGFSCVFFRAVSLLVTQSSGRLPRSPAAPPVMEILHPLSSSPPSPALFALCRHSALTLAPFKSLGGASSLPLSARLIDGQPLPRALCASLSFGKPMRAALRYSAANTRVLFNKWENQQKKTNRVYCCTFLCPPHSDVLAALLQVLMEFRILQNKCCICSRNFLRHSVYNSTQSPQPGSLYKILLTLLCTLITNHESHKKKFFHL